jgi:hypothetical protein
LPQLLQATRTETPLSLSRFLLANFKIMLLNPFDYAASELLHIQWLCESAHLPQRTNLAGRCEAAHAWMVGAAGLGAILFDAMPFTLFTPRRFEA